MILRVALLAMIACGLAGFGTIVWMVMPHGDAAVAATSPVTKIKVLVATRPLRPGSLLKSDDVGAREVDEDKLPAGYIADETNARRGLVGGMIRRTLTLGDVISSAEVLRPGDHGFLAAVLRPGFRAVTVAVDAVSGTAGLIWPGDRVDVILTQSMDELGAGRKFAAETVLRDVRVIATDQQLVQGATGVLDTVPARTITLEVSGQTAEMVQVATRLGKLSLAVRSAEYGPSVDKDGTTWAGDVSGALAASPNRPVISTLKVHGGATDSKEYKF